MSNTYTPSEMLALLQDIQERSQQSAAKLSEDGDSHGAWVAIGFRVAQNNFLVPLHETREVFTVPSQVTTVPKSKPWVYGIANLRGELLPLFDLKYFLYGETTKVNKRSRIAVNNHPTLFSGLLLDEVFGLKHFQSEPDKNQNNLSDNAVSPYITGSITQNDTFWNVFSFDALVADPRFLDAAA